MSEQAADAIPAPSVDDAIARDRWIGISPRQMIDESLSVSVVFVLLVAAGIVSLWTPDVLPGLPRWVLIGAVMVAWVGTLVLIPFRVRAMKYQLRQDDFVYRRGVIFQRQVAVPYGRLQLVDVSRGPVARVLGLAELRLVTAASSSGVVIPGLVRHQSEVLRDELIGLAETRRAGL